MANSQLCCQTIPERAQVAVIRTDRLARFKREARLLALLIIRPSTGVDAKY
jgi:hypothetical protein